MNATSAPRQQRREAETHKFAIGQRVCLKTGFGRAPVAAEIFQITATLPPRGNSLQYRIRNDDERHERVTTQDDLVAFSTSPTGTSLIERTFGDGQGTEAKQPRDTQAQAGEGFAQG